MKLIECKEHGPSRYSIICSHLRTQTGLAYFAIESTSSDPGQAWCEDCDSIFSIERGWTDAADQFAGWKLFCETCYHYRLRSHKFLSWVEGAISPESGLSRADSPVPPEAKRY